ncbi:MULTISPECIES: paraquat-inducible protein A [unclassified Colwellia]|uniref:paraquat-inducible protein A n=1 Tax=unclassified Colwellia TaxID=196834 RepID=UPI0015F4FA86|nr:MULTISPECIES: paraquat-inducible protein A [unclassified Colwellia]MBA6233706.1 paraquat-inducible protein A [Colwellia sp. MB02u-7]MBA6237912.1 paraquat-inducible protein A [Colwellia sp. MB02u-11]MBA6257227.1 paraquat-inducible protein A [Colwellia sp. MB3u-28]MBA6258812.1 paraquat-inducible protein A [Colwellia sp. MB3u-41]MBA6300477.1 paraquat-inducible protein A [Colwellia sp. MB3u-22]
MDDQSSSIIECHECALSVNISLLMERQKALCPRCGFLLSAKHHNALDRILAYSITALFFLLLSLPFEFLAFKSNGIERKIDILASLTILNNNNYHVLAVLEVLTIFVIPALILFSLIYLTIALRKGIYPRGGHYLLKLTYKLLPWSMVEIFVVGVLVSLIKIISLADISLGPSFFAYILFSLAMTAAVLHMDKHQLQQLLNYCKSNQASQKKQIEPTKIKEITPRNHLSLVLKKRISVQKTWALLITSIVFYIPANILPIMNTRFLGQDEPSTILGGVILLWEMGSYPIAAVIFVASVAVPMAKMLVLAWLNYSVQHQHSRFSKERVKLYRLAEFVGRWSMVDVYVVIILVTLIQLGNTMSIYPGGAALAFSGVVITTMLAAMSFEPQFIWQTKNNLYSEEYNDQ